MRCSMLQRLPSPGLWPSAGRSAGGQVVRLPWRLRGRPARVHTASRFTVALAGRGAVACAVPVVGNCRQWQRPEFS